MVCIKKNKRIKSFSLALVNLFPQTSDTVTNSTYFTVCACNFFLKEQTILSYKHHSKTYSFLTDFKNYQQGQSLPQSTY